MVNFDLLAIKRINYIRVYSHTESNVVYIDIVYTDQDDIQRSIIYSDYGLNVLNNEEHQKVFPVLMLILFFLFDLQDRREEFYSLCYKGMFDVHRRGYYYVGLRSENLNYVINIKIKKELSHLLKFENLDIRKYQVDAETYRIWDPDTSSYVIADDNDIILLKKYYFEMDILWDRMVDLSRVYEITIENNAIVDKKIQYGIGSNNIDIFIPIQGIDTDKLNELETVIQQPEFKSIGYYFYLDNDITDVSVDNSPGVVINKLIEMSQDYSNLRILARLKAVDEEGNVKTEEDLIQEVDSWNTLFTQTIDNDNFNHLDGFVLESLPTIILDSEGLIDPNQEILLVSRYGAVKKHIHQENEYFILKYHNVPLQWYGSMNVPFDAFWMYDGSVVLPENEDVYGRTYVSERKIITLINYPNSEIPYEDFYHYGMFAKTLYVTPNPDYTSHDLDFLRSISAHAYKYNEAFRYTMFTNDGQPMTQEEIDAQEAYVDEQGWEFATVTDQDGNTQTVLRPKES